jgi:hypothetical protein
MGVFQVSSNKSPWVKIGPAPGGLYTGEQFQGHHGPLVDKNKHINVHDQAKKMTNFQLYFLVKIPILLHKMVQI